ncbi:MAG TPA: ABC transporter ATP-binding protein, partial [Candidatus Sulfopaludibacter sp.]|nr:ABC transporter ATP-binding protein [Candidatus Sulfopaludibacter sp.]
MPQPLLQVSNLSISLKGRPIISDLSLAIAPATVTGLFGESGCGKTTMALGILRLLPPRYRVTGVVRLDGVDLTGLPERELERIRGARIAMVFQDSLLALNPVMRAADQIEEVRRAHPAQALPPGRLCDLAGLPESRRNAYPHELSGGERQRVLLAQALACRPSLVIADEPFTALDAPRVLELSALFRKLKQELGTAFLVIAHSPGVLAAVADEMLVMYAGRIVERGAARQVLRHPLHPYTAGLLRSLEPRDGRLYSSPGNPPGFSTDFAGCA